MINLAILGSTGSIGTQTLEIVDKFQDEINIVSITGNNNIALLKKQMDKYKPKVCSVMNKSNYNNLKNIVDNKTKLLYGIDGIIEAACHSDVDIVLNALSGMIGLKPTFYAIKEKKNIALANKETLVTGGELIMNEVKKNNVRILPVDSEHSAIFQCIKGNSSKEVSKIILTASGGPFRNRKTNDLKNVKISEALNHPNWSMGKKITIDSATLMNKGLEMIEAYYLFNIDPSNIEVVIHPESIIHSGVEFIDHSIIAQMGLPDMRLPIQYALFYPNRMKNNLKSLNLFDIKKLSFEKPDAETFKCLKLAYDAAEIGKSMPTVLNTANEIAVEKFLRRDIQFLDIGNYIEKIMNSHKPAKISSIEDILEIKQWTEMKFNEIH